MIVKPFVGVNAGLDITIGDVPVHYQSLRNLTVEVDEGMHDMLTLDISGLPPRAIKRYIGAPVEATISTGAKFVHTFIGTVESVRPVSTTRGGTVNGSPLQQADIIAFGASYAMRGKKSRHWHNYSLADMAEELATRYGFSLDVPNLPRLHTAYMQQAESDWAALVNYAGEHGMRVNCHGTHLHIYDPRKALGRQRSVHRLSTAADSLSSVPGKIMKLNAAVGLDALDGASVDGVVSVVQDDGLFYDVRTSEVLGTSTATVESRLDHTVHSYSEAKRLVMAGATLDYDSHADVHCLGIAGIYPGGVVDLHRYKGDLDGLWYVQSVKHRVNTSAFVSDVKIARNIGTPLVATATTPYQKPPASRYVKGRWQSSTRQVRRYAS